MLMLRNSSWLAARSASMRFRSVISSAATLMPTICPLRQRVPICDPDTIFVRPIRSLTIDLDAGDRFACAQYRLHDAFNLLRNLRNRLTYGTANVVRDWKPANFGQVLIYHYVTTIGA